MRRITNVTGLTGLLLVRRFLADYARNPVNVAMLVLVPVAFVAAAAGSLSQLARLLSGTTAPGAAMQTVTAGWTAAFVVQSGQGPCIPGSGLQAPSRPAAMR